MYDIKNNCLKPDAAQNTPVTARCKDIGIGPKDRKRDRTTGCPRSLEAFLFLSCDLAMPPIKANRASNERERTEILYFHA